MYTDRNRGQTLDTYEVLDMEILCFNSADMIRTSGYVYDSGDENDTTAETTAETTGGGNGYIILPPVG